MKTLIFPFVGKEASDYVRMARQRGEETIALFGEAMPQIHDAAFPDTFMAYIRDEDVTHLLCPAASVHKFMETFLHGLVLIGESPIQRQMREHRELMKRTDALLAHTKVYRLSRIEVAGLLRQASLIYGESNDEKIMGVIAACSNAPNGNVVEVGSLCGRTAFVLGWMAFRFHLGPVLTVDPWSAVEGSQKDSPVLLTAMTDEWDWEVVAESYAVNVAVLVTKNVRHERKPSAEAAKHFPYGISVLHIDGNHDYEAVKQDVDLWLPKLAPGGWLILDDYVWAHGDGPRRIGDALLERGAHDSYFEAGNALFVRMK